MANLTRVMSKARKIRGVVQPSVQTEYSVALTGVSINGYAGIQVFREKQGVTTAGSSFNIGDTAEYDSYNLSYCGKITKITDKCVTICSYPGSSMARTHKLDLYTFSWRNFDFNEADAIRKNYIETMNH